MDSYLRDNSWFIPSNGKEHFHNRDDEIRDGELVQAWEGANRVSGRHAAPVADVVYLREEKQDGTRMIEKA
jgi:hypothetical protein